MERTSAIPFEMKQLAAEGRFKGYASYYGNVDLQDDIVQPFAFKEWLQENGSRGVPILNAHRMDQVVGYSVSLQEDRTGLLVEGELTLGSTLGRDAYENIKHAMRVGHDPGLSIGYTERGDGGITYDGNIRKLHNLNLLEFSLACVPANPLARVTGVKMDDETLHEILRDRAKSPDGLHQLLKDAGVLSRRERGRFISELSAAAPAGESLRAQMRKAFRDAEAREAKQRDIIEKVMGGTIYEKCKSLVPRHPYESTISVAEQQKRYREECDAYESFDSCCKSEWLKPRPPSDRPEIFFDHSAWGSEVGREYTKALDEIMERVKSCRDADDLGELLDGYGWKEYEVESFQKLL